MYVDAYLKYKKDWDDQLEIFVHPCQDTQHDNAISHLNRHASKKKLLGKIADFPDISKDMTLVIQKILQITKIHAYEYEKKANIQCIDENGTLEITFMISDDLISLLKTL